jgi:hypothetical protein
MSDQDMIGELFARDVSRLDAGAVRGHGLAVHARQGLVASSPFWSMTMSVVRCTIGQFVARN